MLQSLNMEGKRSAMGQNLSIKLFFVSSAACMARRMLSMLPLCL